MQTNLPHRLLTQFADPTDWQERASNKCLYFLRVAVGSTYVVQTKESTKATEKTYTAAFRAFAGLVAFVLWLPMTLIGIALCLSSQTHSEAYQVAQTALSKVPSPEPEHTQTEDPPSPRAAEPPVFSPKRALADRVTTPHPGTIAKLLDEEAAKHVASLSREELLSAFAKVVEAPQSHALPYKKQLVKANLEGCKRNDKQLLAHLTTIFSKISDGELVEYLPFLVGWDSWKELSAEWKKQCTAQKELHSLLQKTFEVLATDSPEKLAEHYLAIKSDENALRLFILLISFPQLGALTKGIHKTHKADHAIFFDLACTLARNPLTLNDATDCIAFIPRALEQQPCAWIKQFHTHESYFLPLCYIVLFEAASAINKKNLKVLADAIDLFLQARGGAKPAIKKQVPNVIEELVRLSVTDDPQNFALLIKAIETNAHNSEARRARVQEKLLEVAHSRIEDKIRDLTLIYNSSVVKTERDKRLDIIIKKYERIAEKLEKRQKALTDKIAAHEEVHTEHTERYHKFALDCMIAFLAMPAADKLAKTVFEAFLPFCATAENLTDGENVSSPIRLRPHIKTMQVFQGAIDACLTGSIPMKENGNPCVSLLVNNQGKFKLGVELPTNTTPATIFEARRELAEVGVRTALNEVFAPAITQVVLDYFLALRTT